MQSHTPSAGKGNGKLPGGLKTLTILTYIGCIIQVITACYAFYLFHSAMMSLQQGGDVEDWFRIKEKYTEHGLAQYAPLIYNSQVILLVIALLCALLCYTGARQMRDLRKRGLFIYLAGELLYPLVGSILIFTFFYTGIMDYIRLIIPVVFSLLYLSYRKYLIN